MAPAKFLMIGCAFLCSASAALGADIKLYEGDKTGAPLIIVSGEIKSGDEKKFTDLAVGRDYATVVLNSDGGMIAPAMEIGRAIKIKGYSTAVFRDEICASSCALIWVAGVRRFIFDGGRVGFHASYMDVNGRLIETGMGNALVGHYFSQLGYGEKAVILATEAPPEKILWLDKESAQNSGITYEAIAANVSGHTQRTTLNSDDNSAISKPQDSYFDDAPSLGRTAKFFAGGLLNAGYKAEIEESDPDNPKIYTGASGNKIGVFFSDCKDKSCNYIELLTTWIDVGRDAADRVVRNFALKENYSNIYYHAEKKELSVYHYIVLGRDGVTVRNFIDNFDYFQKDMSAVEKIAIGN